MKYSEPTNARFFAAVYRGNFGSGRDLQPTGEGSPSSGVVLPKNSKNKERARQAPFGMQRINDATSSAGSVNGNDPHHDGARSRVIDGGAPPSSAGRGAMRDLFCFVLSVQ